MKSFFDKITGSSSDDSTFELDMDRKTSDEISEENMAWLEHEERETELSVDVCQDTDNIYVKAFVPGISGNELDIDISRDVVSIKGTVKEAYTVEEDDYFQRELSWGSFSRTILLPKEIDIEAATATSKNGLVVLKLPKVDKDRKTKLNVMEK